MNWSKSLPSMLALAGGILAVGILLAAEPAEAEGMKCLEQVRLVPGVGPACRVATGELAYFDEKGFYMGTTHGPDPAPASVEGVNGQAGFSCDNMDGTFPPVQELDCDGDGQNEVSRQPMCAHEAYPTGTQYKIHVIYARSTTDTTSMFGNADEARKSLRRYMQFASAQLHDEAVLQGKEADYIYECAKPGDTPGDDCTPWPKDNGLTANLVDGHPEWCIQVDVHDDVVENPTYPMDHAIPACRGAHSWVLGDLGGVEMLMRCQYNYPDSQNIKYAVFIDEPGGCASGCGGVGNWGNDPSASVGNSNNGNYAPGAMWAATYQSWIFTFMHENGHNMGAVQTAAVSGTPDSNNAAHCNDEHDIMCYYEGAGNGANGDSFYQGPPTNKPKDCLDKPGGGSGFTNHFDCRGDSYFNTNPPADAEHEWIRTHWNIGANNEDPTIFGAGVTPYRNRFLFFGNRVPGTVAETYTMHEDALDTATGIPAAEAGLGLTIETTGGGHAYLKVPESQGVLKRGLDTDGDGDPLTARPAEPFTGWLPGLSKNGAANVDPFGPTDTPTDGRFIGFRLDSNGAFMYSPAPGFFGTATFRYVAHDTKVASVPQQVTIEVLPTNDAPTFALAADAASGTGAFSLPEDTVLGAGLPFLAAPPSKGPFEDAQVLTWEVASYTAGIFDAASPPEVTGAPEAPLLDFTLMPDAYTLAGSPATICLVLRDNGGTARGGDDTSDTACVQVKVNEVNDPMVPAPDVWTVCDLTLPFNNDPLFPLVNDLAANNAGPDAGLGETVSLTTTDSARVTVLGDELRFDSSGLNAGAVETFRYRAGDSRTAPAAFLEGEVTVTVIQCNLWPVDDAFHTTNEDTELHSPGGRTIAGSLLLNDRIRLRNEPENPDSLVESYRIEIVTPPQHAASFATVNETFTFPDNTEMFWWLSGEFLYTPEKDFHGVDWFEYVLVDTTLGAGDAATDPANVTITVLPINDAPVALPFSVGTGEDVALTIPFVKAPPAVSPASDVDGDPLTFEFIKVQTPGVLAADLRGALQHTGGTTALYTPPFDVGGFTTYFAYRVNDGALNSDYALVSVAVGSLNDHPRGQPDFYTARPGQQLVVSYGSGVLANDRDPEGNPMTAVLFDAPRHGTLHLGSDGGFRYTADAGFSGTDTFLYQPKDNGVGADVIVTITVQGNLPPNALFSANPVEVEAGDTIAFRDASSDADGRIVSWAWNFGDGHSSTDRSPGHTYSSAGSYRVTLTVTDNEGASRTYGDRVLVSVALSPQEEAEMGGSGSASGGRLPPVAEAGPDVAAPAEGFVRLHGSSPQQVISYTWEQVDGPAVELTMMDASDVAFYAPEVPDGETVVLAFELVVYDGFMESLPDGMIVVVQGAVPPTPTFRLPSDFATPGGTQFQVPVTLTGLPLQVSQVDARWSTVRGPALGTPTCTGSTCTFTAPVVATATQVELELTGRVGSVDITPDRLVVTIEPPAVPPAIEYAKGKLDKAGVVAFAARPGDVQPVAIHWDFGDSATSEEQEPVHVYAQSGTYTVTMTLTDESGTSHTVQETVKVQLRERSTGSGSKGSPGPAAGLLALAALAAAAVALRRKD